MQLVVLYIMNYQYCFQSLSSDVTVKNKFILYICNCLKLIYLIVFFPALKSILKGHIMMVTACTIVF